MARKLAHLKRSYGKIHGISQVLILLQSSNKIPARSVPYIDTVLMWSI